MTGSLIYIETFNHRILVDCGMHQTNDRYEDYLVNNRKFKEFKVKDIDFVFVTHNHIDHVGLIPKLYRDGFRGATIISENSKQILKDMTLDSAYINERDILMINSQHNKNYKPLYSVSDVYKMLEYTLEKPVNQKIVIDDELAFELVPAGHILGSCQVKLYFSIDGTTKTLLVTGDLGNKIVGNRFVGEYQQVEYADVVIGESTYGDRPDIKTGIKERKNDLDKFKSIIDTQIHEMNGRVIIPSFSMSRSQQLALMLYEMYKDSEWKPKIYIDSPLTIKIFEDYAECLDGQDKIDFDSMMTSNMFTFIKESEDSKHLVASNEPCLIISSSGMCQSGRIRHHLKRCVPDPNTTALFVGFSTEGSLASLLKDNKRKTITIDQKEYPCRCASYSLKSLSGHAPFWQLVDIYTNINTNKIILHHGSKTAKETLKKELDKQFEKMCKSTRVVISNSSLKITL
ncbi:MBL fold metallo-hydrolase [Blautia obeum]|uniref:MBL fold metallo-hydrolase n=1 Tax=Blautia obeum TaxID=40520 RepID=A0A414SK31_9FIRM|nr:MBL fold metallo-hydrolase [Blautia obeum]RHG19948.1 MBL fold metallo-hydrolase [Blautia obeum]